MKNEVSDFPSSDSRKGESGGTLYVVATPIGNLDDLSPRATRTLASVDVVAAEDTRHSGRLLSHLGIQKRMIALHDHNEKDRAAGILAELQAGRDVALISDAGTPLISDPGYVLVREARAAGHRVSPIPGPCALVAALSAAGLPTDRFLYVGFLPAKRSGRKASLDLLSSEVATLVFYESPHRILESVRDIGEVLGSDREIVLGREITKTFETFYSGSVAEVLAELERDPHGSRGEFVVMVRGAMAQPGNSKEATMDVDRVLRVLLAELPVKKVAKMAAELTGLSKNELYQRALELKDG
ncbi:MULTISPECIES: 16S rRNA (cytidine(1402)-2'-O)-methyltransferase [Marinobacter]|uniref:16S rRNA (cytidine(1402)-2'-O)-methyltransferase n=1 Tax=Marinobacter TaxID=2742 RepID=UPI0007D8E687|nr:MULTISPECIES: 16S rRNA (cytidine(1402)-2'-O)-methyltransferase [unclassified Marinobacter]MBL3824696.1 16S rRNA (cytidine(1402)-2'-O)-methyltransferase [Marinobacter sp. MC3]MBL3893202.1 16S rRNA (cytidine(1402)-2'-O)-methyltransferase [Marinobacter sp. MW3]OAN87347.1 16S rRNA (cytidine(1402)-2'-O)-methyltransferase [Marinobacter sp. EhC06]OAN95185.1 16S rRNA (cytidine(1402)-2'-O)-methyltransferase [Marinobacter sp. EhN04]